MTDPIDWDTCLKEIEESSLSAQVYHLLKQQDLLFNIPDFVRSQLRMDSERVLIQNLLMKQQLDSVLRAFDEKGIDVIVLKGIRFSERYFGNFAARPTSDIDIVIHHTDMERTIERLRELDFGGPHEFNPIHFHCVMTKRVSQLKLPVSVELHWGITNERTAHVNMGLLWQKANQLEPYTHVRELSLQHTFYAICLHGANHKMDSWKYVHDIVHLLYRFGDHIEYLDLVEQTKLDCTRKKVALVLTLVYNLFPELYGLKPLPSALRVSKGTNFERTKWDFFLVDSWRDRMGLIRDLIWPPIQTVKWHLQNEGVKQYSNPYLAFYSLRIRKIGRQLAGIKHFVL